MHVILGSLHRTFNVVWSFLCLADGLLGGGVFGFCEEIKGLVYFDMADDDVIGCSKGRRGDAGKGVLYSDADVFRVLKGFI